MQPYVKLILGIQAAGYSIVSLKTVLSLNLFKPYQIFRKFLRKYCLPPLLLFLMCNLPSLVATKYNYMEQLFAKVELNSAIALLYLGDNS